MKERFDDIIKRNHDRDVAIKESCAKKNEKHLQRMEYVHKLRQISIKVRGKNEQMGQAENVRNMRLMNEDKEKYQKAYQQHLWVEAEKERVELQRQAKLHQEQMAVAKVKRAQEEKAAEAFAAAEELREQELSDKLQQDLFRRQAVLRAKGRASEGKFTKAMRNRRVLGAR